MCVVALVPVGLLLLSMVGFLVSFGGVDEPEVCEHPWYIDERCIICGTPR